MTKEGKKMMDTASFKVLSRTLEYVQKHVSSAITIDALRAYCFVVTSGGSCSLKDIVAFFGDKSVGSSYSIISRLQKTYRANTKDYPGYDLVVFKGDPADLRLIEVTLTGKGREIASALSDVFNAALVRAGK